MNMSSSPDGRGHRGVRVLRGRVGGVRLAPVRDRARIAVFVRRHGRVRRRRPPERRRPVSAVRAVADPPGTMDRTPACTSHDPDLWFGPDGEHRATGRPARSGPRPSAPAACSAPPACGREGTRGAVRHLGRRGSRASLPPHVRQRPAPDDRREHLRQPRRRQELPGLPQLLRTAEGVMTIPVLVVLAVIASAFTKLNAVDPRPPRHRPAADARVRRRAARPGRGPGGDRPGDRPGRRPRFYPAANGA